MNDLAFNIFLSNKNACLYKQSNKIFLETLDEVEDEKKSNYSFVTLLNRSMKNYKVCKKQEHKFMSDTIELKLSTHKLRSYIYKNDYDWIKSFIGNAQNMCKKVVWYNDYYLEFDRNNLKLLLRNCLCQFNHHGYIFKLDSEILFVNSPELLLEQNQGGKLKTYALAGTSKEQDVLQTEKFKYEHLNVAHDIVMKLSNSSYNYKLHEKQTIRYGDLFHLKQQISIDSNRFNDLVKILHPTSALFTDNFLHRDLIVSSMESFKKKDSLLYGGLIIVKKSKLRRAIVNIRSMRLKNNTLWIRNGCGITKESTFVKEVDESMNKALSVLSYAES